MVLEEISLMCFVFMVLFLGLRIIFCLLSCFLDYFFLVFFSRDRGFCHECMHTPPKLDGTFPGVNLFISLPIYLVNSLLLYCSNIFCNIILYYYF